MAGWSHSVSRILQRKQKGILLNISQYLDGGRSLGLLTSTIVHCYFFRCFFYIYFHRIQSKKTNTKETIRYFDFYFKNNLMIFSYI